MDVEVGITQVCALDEDGTASCFGHNLGPCGFYAQCEVLPTLSVKLANASSGYEHACGLRRDDGRAVCWTWTAGAHLRAKYLGVL